MKNGNPILVILQLNVCDVANIPGLGRMDAARAPTHIVSFR